jgi:uncharacterized repeat protein (TIGR03803 family)
MGHKNRSLLTAIVSIHPDGFQNISRSLLKGPNFFGSQSTMLKSVFLVASVHLALSAQTLTTEITFNDANGSGPSVLLRASDGNYYGATVGGGSGHGTIFRLTPAGALTTIYTFTAMPGLPGNAGADGGGPVALTQGDDGNFYGATTRGGASSDVPYGGGTVFKITPAGVLTTLHSFTMSEGYSPGGALIQASDGNFYGVTTEGGSGFNGAVFKITPSGTLTILHGFSFEEGIACSSLVESADGTLYGCTGGSGDSGGEVYKVTTTGVVSSFYSFSASDGDGPTGLIQGSDGNFYGTTYFGGPVATAPFSSSRRVALLQRSTGFLPAKGRTPAPCSRPATATFTDYCSMAESATREPSLDSLLPAF